MLRTYCELAWELVVLPRLECLLRVKEEQELKQKRQT